MVIFLKYSDFEVFIKFLPDHCNCLKLTSQVDDMTRMGEGYNIASSEQCAKYCDLVPDCRHWTWYSYHCKHQHK